MYICILGCWHLRQSGLYYFPALILSFLLTPTRTTQKNGHHIFPWKDYSCSKRGNWQVVYNLHLCCVPISVLQQWPNMIPFLSIVYPSIRDKNHVCCMLLQCHQQFAMRSVCPPLPHYVAAILPLTLHLFKSFVGVEYSTGISIQNWKDTVRLWTSL